MILRWEFIKKSWEIIYQSPYFCLKVHRPSYYVEFYQCLYTTYSLIILSTNTFARLIIYFNDKEIVEGWVYDVKISNSKD